MSETWRFTPVAACGITRPAYHKESLSGERDGSTRLGDSGTKTLECLNGGWCSQKLSSTFHPKMRMPPPTSSLLYTPNDRKSTRQYRNKSPSHPHYLQPRVRSDGVSYSPKSRSPSRTKKLCSDSEPRSSSATLPGELSTRSDVGGVKTDEEVSLVVWSR